MCFFMADIPLNMGFPPLRNCGWGGSGSSDRGIDFSIYNLPYQGRFVAIIVWKVSVVIHSRFTEEVK